MNINQTATTMRIHPLIAGAAASVILVSLVGVAAMTGFLPKTHSAQANLATFSQSPVPIENRLSHPAMAPAPDTYEQSQGVRNCAPVEAKPRQAEQRAAPAYVRPAVYKVPVVRTRHSVSGQPQQTRYPRQAATQQNSPVGIGIGAVIGGLVGNQVGGGNGRTLATIAGAIGGGYLGNEVAKRY